MKKKRRAARRGRRPEPTIIIGLCLLALGLTAFLALRDSAAFATGTGTEVAVPGYTAAGSIPDAEVAGPPESELPAAGEGLVEGEAILGGEPAPNPEASPPVEDKPGATSIPARVAASPAPSPAGGEPPPAKSAPEIAASAARPERAAKGAVYIVIDDVGYSLPQLDRLLATELSLTYAVLPGLKDSAACAARVRAAGRELLIHQPMEALGGDDPGPLAIRRGMGREEIRRVLAASLASVPGAVGMNNHMGSAATADPAVMRVVLEFCREKGLFFLDSMTTDKSVVGAVAAKMGMAIAERQVFLDNAQDRPSILTSIREGIKRAERGGYAVMIGHVWSSDLAQALADMYPEMLEAGLPAGYLAALVAGGDVDDPRTR